MLKERSFILKSMGANTATGKEPVARISVDLGEILTIGATPLRSNRLGILTTRRGVGKESGQALLFHKQRLRGGMGRGLGLWGEKGYRQ